MNKEFWSVKQGDVLIRMLAGTVPLKVKVVKVDENLIHVAGGWTFSRATGAEEDPELGWGDKFGQTGSYLKWKE